MKKNLRPYFFCFYTYLHEIQSRYRKRSKVTDGNTGWTDNENCKLGTSQKIMAKGVFPILLGPCILNFMST